LGGVSEDGYEAVRAAGLKAYVQAKKTTAFVDLQAIRAFGGDYLATISSNSRYQIRRALKIYESRGPLTVQPARSTEEALAFFEQLGELHERAWSSEPAAAPGAFRSSSPFTGA
jgi:aspartate aminotransferase-like enzyme